MTIRMQESEAAENFSRFLAHLEAGDQVQVEREGKPALIAAGHIFERVPADAPRGSLEAAQAFFKRYSPMLADEEYVQSMKEVHEALNQPLEPRF